MAYQSGTAPRYCAECKVEATFYKMFQSYRKDHVWYDDEGRPKAVLFCVDCEVKNRQKEWESWTDEEKKVAGKDYPTIDAVRKDQKSRNKEGWAARSEPIKRSKAALKALKEKSEEVTQVNFVKCMEMMSLEDKKDEEAVDEAALAVPGASHDGPGGGGCG